MKRNLVKTFGCKFIIIYNNSFEKQFEYNLALFVVRLFFPFIFSGYSAYVELLLRKK